MKKRNLLSLVIVVLFTNLFSSCVTDNKMIRIGLIADTQYCDCETKGSRFYRDALPKLDRAVSDLNKSDVQFTVHLGDLVDRDTPISLEPILNSLSRLDQKVCITPGNHDYNGITDNDVLYKQLEMPASYYSFTHKGWRFIMLNTNEVSSYANIGGTPFEAELNAMMKAIQENGRKNGASYNGGISKAQLQWLKQELDAAQQKDEKVMVFSHHPLYVSASPGLTALNDQEIVDLLTIYPCVKAGISGHHHPGDFATYKGIHFITTEGMVETENENAYGILELTDDQIILKGIERTKSYTLNFR